MNKTVLAINALDPSGATGISVDLRMIQNFRFYCCPVLTGIFHQNTRTLTSHFFFPFEQIGQQLDAIFSDLVVHGAKISGILDPSLAKFIASLIGPMKFGWTIFDPHFFHLRQPLLPPEHLSAICKAFFPVVSCTILNLKEAEALLGHPIPDLQAMHEAAKEIHALGAGTLVLTGGDLEGKATDLFYDGTRLNHFEIQKQPTQNLLGLGDAYGSFLLCSLIQGSQYTQAMQTAKMYFKKTMLHNFPIGKGLHPINLNTPL
jgi:hydroxymethylpyrimidine/phosphomethylpyrimidine kinase